MMVWTTTSIKPFTQLSHCPLTQQVLIVHEWSAVDKAALMVSLTELRPALVWHEAPVSLSHTFYEIPSKSSLLVWTDMDVKCNLTGWAKAYNCEALIPAV